MFLFLSYNLSHCIFLNIVLSNNVQRKVLKRVKSNYRAACLPVGKGVKEISLDAAK